MGSSAREAAQALRIAPALQRSRAIGEIAKELQLRSDKILAANKEDVASATTMIDRLMLNEERLEAMVRAVEEIAGLPDPLGQVMDRWTRPNGLEISRILPPIGVSALISKSRPTVPPEALAIGRRSST